MNTIFLDAVAWDLALDASGNIAMAGDPYALAQDAASAIRTFLGEVWFDESAGVPYASEILGRRPPLALLKERMEQAALTVPGVAAASCYLSEAADRQIVGQVQVRSAATGQVVAATFSTVNPQGSG